MDFLNKTYYKLNWDFVSFKCIKTLGVLNIQLLFVYLMKKRISNITNIFYLDNSKNLFVLCLIT